MQYEIVIRLCTGVNYFFSILNWALVLYALLSWIARPESRIYRFFANFCDPLVAPFRPLGRKLINARLRVDLSVWLAVIALRVINTVVIRILFALL
ncbi:MAG: YggT family protein [Clostridia bacterium]|nr:YggT family protein [Clostridia bacterium]